MQTVLVDFYEILEIPRDSTAEQIRAAVTQQRRVWFKRQQSPNQEKRHQAEERVRQLDEAQKTLGNPQDRKQYDQQLASYVQPQAAAGPTVQGSSDWLVRAREFLRANDAHSAAYAARQATDQHGANDQAWAVRGESSMMLGRVTDAVFEYNEAIRIHPLPDYYFDLGTVYEAVQDWSNALNSYNYAKQMDPSEPLYSVAVASVYLQNKKPTQALLLLEEAHRQKPDNDVFNFYLAWALHDAAFLEWTPLNNGNRIITTQAQAQKTLTDVQRALSLSFDDPGMRAELEDTLRLANSAMQVRWALDTQKTLGFGAVVLVMALCGLSSMSSGAAGGLLLLLIAGGVGYGTYQFGRQPGWKINNRDSLLFQVR